MWWDLVKVAVILFTAGLVMWLLTWALGGMDDE